jgi:hypothetical protein
MHNNKRRDEMNKHIELVKKWLDDPNSVTKEELNENAAAAWSAYEAAAYAAAYYTADASEAASAAYWVKKYEELTGEFGEV